MEDRLKQIEERICRACARVHRRREDVTLIGVSKHQPLEAITQGYAASIRDFGENYVQEMVEKQRALKDLDIHWHFIGALQRNKVRALLEARPALIHSVDSVALAEKLNVVAAENHQHIACLLELRIGDENSAKTGVLEDDFWELLKVVDSLENLTPQGLMLIPPLGGQPEDSRPYFQKLRAILDQANAQRKEPLKHLSMGMSDDFEIAIEEGATLIRVGTAIFGKRLY